MIIAKLVNQSEINSIKEFLFNNELIDLYNEEDLKYILKENEELIGVSQAKLAKNYAILDYLVIDTKYRGNYYGDGLLRSILNYLYLKNINDVYFLNNNDFLLKEGFREISKNEIENLIGFDNVNNILYLNLADFFSQGCKSSRR